MEATSPAPMRGLMPDVMAPRRSKRGVEHGVVDGGGQEQADDVALGHTEAGQVAGHAVGGAVPFGEGQAAAGPPRPPGSTYASTSPLTRAASRRTDTTVSC